MKKKPDKNKGGRPTDYKTKYNKQAEKLCKLGATDKEIADFFEVNVSTINVWKLKFPKFKESIKKGKIEADANVSDSLYKRALGYSHREEKCFQHNGEVITHKTTKHYPPDTAAACFWLKNRRRNTEGHRWKDSQEIDHNITDYSSIAKKARDLLKD
jgi:hypothetical protein